MGALPHHAAVKAHAGTCGGFRGGWQAARRSCPRYALAGSRSHLRVDRGYVDFARLYVLHQAGPSSSRVPSRTSMLIASIRRRRIARPASFATRPSLDGFYTRQEPRTSALQGPRVRQDAGFITNNFSLPAATICALYKSRCQVELFFKWIKQHLRIKQFSERGEDADLNCRLGLRPRRHRQEASDGRLALHFVTDPLGFEKMPMASSTCGRRKQMQRFANNQPIGLFDF